MANNIAQLILEAARARAEGTQAQGRIWGTAVQNLGQIPGQVVAANKQAADEALKQKLGQSELTARSNDAKLQQDKLDQIAEAKQAEQATSALVAQHTKTDPDTGQHITDHQAVAQGLMAINPKFANQYMADAEARTTHANTIQKQELEGTIAKNKYYADSVLGPLADAKPEDYQTQLAIARGNLAGLGVPPTHPVYAALASTPDQATVAKLRDQYRGSAATQEAALKSADITAKGTQSAKDAAEAKAADARVKEIEATLNGTTPIAPAKLKELQIERDRLAETVRAHKATEAAANPLAALAGGGGSAAAQPTDQPPNPTGEDVLAKLPPAVASQVKALAEGRMQFPAGFALKAPYWQSMISLVSQYDPSFDAVNYNARSKTRADFTSGKSAQTINALNTVAQHLNVLSDAADKLNNSSFQTYNTLANWMAKKTGDPTVTNFETAKKAVTDELTRAWRGAGGSEGDVKSWAQVLDASESPEQLHGAIAQMGNLLEGKLSALETQFKQGMGPKASDMSVITPEARTVLSTLEQRASGQKDTTGPAKGEKRTYNGETRVWNGTEWIKQ